MWYNAIFRAILRSPLHPMLGGNFALITVTGRKSGKQISTPVNLTLIDGAYWILSLRERTWWRNLRGGASATVLLGGKTRYMPAEVIETPAAVSTGLQGYLAANPNMPKMMGIQTGADGQPYPAALEAAAARHVLVKLTPAEAA